MAFRIGLDSGHGGDDPGAVAPPYKEDALNDTITRKLEELLAADKRFTPILLAPYGVTIGVNERARKANAANLDMLISNHFNAGGGDGWEIYPEVPRPKGSPRYWIHIASLTYARILAQEMSQIQQLRGPDDGIRYRYLGDNSYFGIVRLTNCPAVLVENAFIDNPVDMADFDTPEKLAVVAQKQYDALVRYFAGNAGKV